MAVEQQDQAADVARLHGLIRSALPDLAEDDGGFGPFHYRYASGREGNAHRVSVVPRKTGISLYVLAVTEDGRYLVDSRADQFPRAAVGKGCIRFKRLDYLDLDALRDLLVEAGRLPAPGAV
jgi:hypothetical protein